jgi:hypothetical protein
MRIVHTVLDTMSQVLSELPLWAQEVKKEIDQTILLSWFFSQNIDKTVKNSYS